MRRVLPVILLAVACLAGGVWLGGHPDRLPGGVRDALVHENTAVIGDALGTIERRFYREVPDEQVRDAALKGAVEALGDEYSAYLSPEDLVRFQEMTESRFEGIGVVVQKAPNGLRVTRVYDGSPAKAAGLRSGDVIVRAGGKSLAGLATDAASARVRGPEGTSVQLDIARGEQVLKKRVKRAQVRVPVVASRYREQDRVGVVALSQFSTGAHGELSQAIEELRGRGARAIVLDLRGNPGGLVSEAVAVSSLFLDDEPVVSMRGRAVRTRTYRAEGDAPFPELPLAVLVDEGSASAAEIVTGALQDHERAEVIGTRTYGKGVFQEVMPISGGGALDLTVGQYFTPDGRNLGGKGSSRGKGLTPDRKAQDDPETPADEALEAAVRTAVAEAG